MRFEELIVESFSPPVEGAVYIGDNASRLAPSSKVRSILQKAEKEGKIKIAFWKSPTDFLLEIPMSDFRGLKRDGEAFVDLGGGFTFAAEWPD